MLPEDANASKINPIQSYNGQFVKCRHTSAERLMKQLIEPSSAVTVAAAVFDKLGVRDQNVVCVLSAGDVDLVNLKLLKKMKKLTKVID